MTSPPDPPAPSSRVYGVRVGGYWVTAWPDDVAWEDSLWFGSGLYGLRDRGPRLIAPLWREDDRYLDVLRERYGVEFEELPPEAFADRIFHISLDLGEDRPRLPDTFVGNLQQAIAAALDERIALYREHGRDLADEYDPDKLAREMVEALLPVPSPWSDIIGTAYRQSSVSARLNLEPADLAALVDRREVLELITSDQIPIYPAWQFTTAGLVEGLAAVLDAVLVDGIDPWTVAGWLRTREDALSESPIDALRAGRVTDVVRVARRAGVRFSQ